MASCFLFSLFVASGAHATPMRKVEEITTAGGVRVWLVEEPAIPLVSIRFAIRGGALRDPAGKEGVGTLVAALLTEGAGELDSTAFARKVADEAAQLAFMGGRDRIVGGLDVLAKRLDAAAELLRLTLLAPRFEADAFERAKNQRLADLDLAASDPRRIAYERWYAESFPGQPYGRPVDGTRDSVSAITRQDVLDQAPRLLDRGALTVVVVGAIDRERATLVLDRIFGAMPDRGSQGPGEKPVQRRLERPVMVERDLPLATAAFGAVTLSTRDPDYPVLQVLNQVIGSGEFDSTLMEEIRVRRGLAYSVSTSLRGDGETTVLLGGMSTANERMAEALEVLRQSLARVAAEGPTPAQFENAKSHLTGSWPLDLDSNAKLAATLLRIRLDGKGPEYVEERNPRLERVTIEDVKRVAREVLAWERFNVVVVGRAAAGR